MARTETRRTVSDYKYTCDVCGGTAKGSRCSCCSRDVCGKCYTDDPQDWGDHPRKYCSVCWALPERKAFMAYRAESEERLYQLEKAWDEAGKALRSNTEEANGG